jgi:hypothetical protein
MAEVPYTQSKTAHPRIENWRQNNLILWCREVSDYSHLWRSGLHSMSRPGSNKSSWNCRNLAANCPQKDIAAERNRFLIPSSLCGPSSHQRHGSERDSSARCHLRRCKRSARRREKAERWRGYLSRREFFALWLAQPLR